MKWGAYFPRCYRALWVVLLASSAVAPAACDQPIPTGDAIPEGEIRKLPQALAPSSGLVGGLVGAVATLLCSSDADCVQPGQSVCIVPVCDPTLGTCSTTNAPDGTACDDGSACTQTDVCRAGTCTGLKPVMCTASDQCHDLGACDPQSGKCSNPPKSPGSACSDGNPCTYGETCSSDGSCRGGATITCDDDMCNKRSCNGTSACTVTPKTASTCDDANLCTYGDVCTANGTCAGTPIVCADDQSATRTCNGTSTCTVTPRSGAACDDGNPCTQGDVMLANGSCAGMPYQCPVKDCLVSSVCDGKGGCTSVARPDGTACDADGSKCTPKDTCQAGVCKPDQSPVRCVARDCNTVACNPTTGSCDYTPTTGDACGVSGCYSSGTCDQGVCSGRPKDCSMLDSPCTTGVCDVVTGECAAADKPNGASCNPGGLCSAGAVCAFGACELAPATCPDATGPCKIPACNPDDGKCIETNQPAGAACDPGNSCITAATCDSNGRCTGIPAPNGQPCTAGGGLIGRCAIGTCTANGNNTGDDGGTDATGDDGGMVPGAKGGCCAIAPAKNAGTAGITMTLALMAAAVSLRRRRR